MGLEGVTALTVALGIGEAIAILFWNLALVLGLVGVLGCVLGAQVG